MAAVGVTWSPGSKTAGVFTQRIGESVEGQGFPSSGPGAKTGYGSLFSEYWGWVPWKMLKAVFEGCFLK